MWHKHEQSFRFSSLVNNNKKQSVRSPCDVAFPHAYTYAHDACAYRPVLMPMLMPMPIGPCLCLCSCLCL